MAHDAVHSPARSVNKPERHKNHGEEWIYFSFRNSILFNRTAGLRQQEQMSLIVIHFDQDIGGSNC